MNYDKCEWEGCPRTATTRIKVGEQWYDLCKECTGFVNLDRNLTPEDKKNLTKLLTEGS